MQCQKKKADGRPCGARALCGQRQCALHAEPGKAAELGSKGGRRRAVYSLDTLKEFEPPRTAAELRDLLAQSIIEIRTGKLDPKLANSISYLGAGFLRASEVLVDFTESMGDAKGVWHLKSFRYALDTGVSRFTVRAFASGMLSAFGHSPTFAIRQYSGEIQFNPQAPEGASLKMVIKAASIEVADNISDKDRRDIETEMRDRVLEIGKYPEIVYECSRVTLNKTGDDQYSVALNGDPTLHGVTRGQSVTAKIAVTGDVLRAFGECSLRQSDYNIKLVSAMGGGLKVKDEVKLAFDLVARKLV